METFLEFFMKLLIYVFRFKQMTGETPEVRFDKRKPREKKEREKKRKRERKERKREK